MDINRISGTTHGSVGPNAPPPSKPHVSLSPAAIAAATAVPDNVARVAAPQAPKKTEISDAEIKQSLEAINHFLKPVNGDIEFSQDDETGRTLVKIVDKQTQTVLRQIPTEEALAIAKELDRLQGLLVKEKA